jgi:hypothetical protein
MGNVTIQIAIGSIVVSSSLGVWGLIMLFSKIRKNWREGNLALKKIKEIESQESTNEQVQIILNKINERRLEPAFINGNLGSIKEFFDLEPKMKSECLTILLSMNEIKPDGFGDYTFKKSRYDSNGQSFRMYRSF